MLRIAKGIKKGKIRCLNKCVCLQCVSFWIKKWSRRSNISLQTGTLERLTLEEIVFFFFFLGRFKYKCTPDLVLFIEVFFIWGWVQIGMAAFDFLNPPVMLPCGIPGPALGGSSLGPTSRAEQQQQQAEHHWGFSSSCPFTSLWL